MRVHWYRGRGMNRGGKKRNTKYKSLKGYDHLIQHAYNDLAGELRCVEETIRSRMGFGNDRRPGHVDGSRQNGPSQQGIDKHRLSRQHRFCMGENGGRVQNNGSASC